MPSPAEGRLETRRLIATAGAAPSMHNTQPWRFSVYGDETVRLRADLDRRLTVADPRDRCLHISCGAALLNLRLALRVAGYDPVTWLLPRTEESEMKVPLLAVVRPARSIPPSGEERRLYDAIAARHTNRRPFSGCIVPRPIMHELVRAARSEGTDLIIVDTRISDTFLQQIGMADTRLHADGDYRAELARWTTDVPRTDGIPPDHLGPGGGTGTLNRDFGQLPASDTRWETRPQLAVLTTWDDHPLDWLRAGQALQRVLLVATLYGVSASFLNQPLDLRDMRGRTDPRHHRAHPQMIIRFGYGPAVLGTPRRPVSDILETA